MLKSNQHKLNEVFLMERGSTIFLKVAVILIGIPILALCIFWLPGFVNYLPYPILIGVYTTAIAFFFALYQALKLLSYIDKNKAFSELSVNALKYIKYCAITISTIYAVLIPFLFPIADADDAPGLVAFPGIIVFASIVIGVFAAVLQKLLKEAIDIKSENDLTV
jgi:MFS superfamily sulfate permease-like transporter